MDFTKSVSAAARRAAADHASDRAILAPLSSEGPQTGAIFGIDQRVRFPVSSLETCVPGKAQPVYKAQANVTGGLPAIPRIN